VSFLVELDELVDMSQDESIWTGLMIVKLEVHSVLNHCTETWDTFPQSVY